MKKIYLLLSLVLIIILYNIYSGYISLSMLVGTYITVKPDDYKAAVPDIPSKTDTLIIYNNGTFSSGFFGMGKYTLSHNLFTTEIDLNYHYNFGMAGYTSTISRSFLGVPKIELDADNNYYYEKVN
jgi:hypothetical protein